LQSVRQRCGCHDNDALGSRLRGQRRSDREARGTEKKRSTIQQIH
jgi:hypothetical protein